MYERDKRLDGKVLPSWEWMERSPLLFFEFSFELGNTPRGLRSALDCHPTRLLLR